MAKTLHFWTPHLNPNDAHHDFHIEYDDEPLSDRTKGRGKGANRDDLDDSKPSGRAKPSGPRQAKSVDNVINSAIFQLSQRDHTISELRSKLGRKTDNPEWIEQALTRCLELGYLRSDEQFARYFCEQAYSNLRGAAYIRKTLAKKGIDAAVIERSIITASSEMGIDEAVMVAQLLAEYPTLETISKEALTNQFYRRGFSAAQLNQTLAEHPERQLLKSKAQLKGAKASLERELLKLVRKHKGLAVIRQELRAKHIDIDGLEALVDKLSRSGDIDLFESAKTCLERKRMALDSHQDRSKAYGYLMRRGFNSEQVKYAIEELSQSE
ncbi:RecX family transcriptional regulator [Ferrimonas senticii]|uniref:RecX family transcriptional regulator n=1 Tax=Ferrimonas senticii TaxID=394566 RepID=UPI0006885FA7|nr:RecX family transcriptional regulator [Ferrimonas senticii]